MVAIFGKTGHPLCTMGWIGHSQISWETLNTNQQLVRDAHIALYTKQEANASEVFFITPNLHEH